MYDAPHQRVKKVSITLECTPGSHRLVGAVFVLYGSLGAVMYLSERPSGGVVPSQYRAAPIEDARR